MLGHLEYIMAILVYFIAILGQFGIFPPFMSRRIWQLCEKGERKYAFHFNQSVTDIF
jgi:hypothetical protein